MYTISEETVDEDLDKFWETIIARLNEKTKWNLNAKNSASIDQVLLKIVPPKDQTPQQHAKMKKVGAFAAQAASMVFGPANQCFNAINFVISAAQQYKEVFNKITTLMERVSVFLENLSGFMNNNNADVKLDKRLRKTVYRILEHFLRIMSTTYDLTNSRTARLKLMATSFAFGEDEGISGYLATLETLVSDFTGAQISVIVQDLSVAAKDIRSVDRKADVLIEAAEKQSGVLDQLANADASRTQQEREKKDRETIKKALGIEDGKTPWDRQNELWDGHITGTGQWLLERPFYTKWSDAKATAAEVIALKAPSGFGKSHLSSIVVRNLQDKHRGDTKVVIAYYYLQREASEKSSALNKILRTVLWQVARTSREYAKAVVGLCEGLDTSKTSHVWRKLVTDLSKSLELTLFLVLDGIDVLDKVEDSPDLIDIVNQIQSISTDDSSHLRVRTLITGTKEVLDPISGEINPSMPEVDLETTAQDDQPTPNQIDLELVVADRLERAERVKGLDSQLKERIRRELAKGARGEYSRLFYLLDDLVNIQNTNQIEDILQRANQSLNDIVAGKVTVLNNTLSRDEIWEVNQLLDWLAIKYEDLSVMQCEAILSLRADGQSIGLEERIRRRYSEILSVSEDKQVTIRSGVQEYLEGESANSVASARVMTDAIQAPEVALVSKMLQTHFRHVFGDEDVYARFGFPDFFQNKLGDQALKIRIIPSESRLRVAQGCLIAVCDSYDDPKSGVLMPYAYNWVIELLETINLSEIDPATKQDMGRKLTRLLQEQPLIESWFAPQRMYLTGYFVYSEYSRYLIKIIHSWLKDPGVQKGLADMPGVRQWALSMTSSDTPNFALYSNVAKAMAKRWFEASTYEERNNAVIWLCGWTLCMQDKTPEEDDTMPIELIHQIATWAQEQLGNANLVGKWHGTLAVTFESFKYHDESIVEYRSAIALRPTEWHLRVQMAEVLAEKEDYAEAILVVEELINQHKELLGVDDAYTTDYYERFLHDIGDWSIKQKDFTVAERWYQQVLDHGMEQQELTDPTARAIVQMLAVLSSQERYTDSLALLDRCTTLADATGSSWIVLLFRQYSLDDEFHNRLVMIAKRSGGLAQIAGSYERVIETATTDPLVQAWNMGTRYYLAGLMWTVGNANERDSALNLWEEVIHHETVPTYEASIAWLRIYAARDLAPALLTKIRESGGVRLNDAVSMKYIGRLEQLTQADYGRESQSSKDPRMVLARLYHLAGDDTRAKDTVRELLKQAFDATVEGQGDGFYKVAMVLQAVDDDRNALAAWSQLVPFPAEDEESPPDDASDGDDSDTNDQTSDTADVEEATDGQADPGADRNLENGIDVTAVDGDASAPQVNGLSSSEDEPATSKTPLKGALNNHCDGACGVQWTYADDIYACKDCLDVQLNAECYHKLKAGELDVAICGSDHNHIHVPPFDEAAWRSLPEGQVRVGGEQILRTEWIERIKREWAIDDDSVKQSRDASRRIQRAWRAYKFLKAATRR